MPVTYTPSNYPQLDSQDALQTYFTNEYKKIADALKSIQNDLGAVALTPQCGRLVFSSPTTLTFAPFAGDRIKINGSVLAIPSTGIGGLTNSGLAPNTTYFVYALNSGGVPVGEFSTTGHVTGSAAGNAGVEVKSSDGSRTLIGMVRTDGSSQFSSSLVNTWFNRKRRVLTATAANNSTISTVFVNFATGLAPFLSWGEVCTARISCFASNSVNGDFGVLGLDDSNAVAILQRTCFAPGFTVNAGDWEGAWTPAEGFCALTFKGLSQAAANTFTVANNTFAVEYSG